VASASHSFPDTATQADAADAYPLWVAAVTREADAVLSLSLRLPEGGDLPAWEPGAHIELHLPSGRIRQYSLCGSPRNREEYRIAVLRERAGRGGSAEIHDFPLAGRQLLVRGPRNHFPLKDSPRHLFIAGGIGVTPILPMITELGPVRPWEMYYGGRSRASMAFAEQALRIGGDRVHVQPKDESGRLDVEGIVRTADARTAIYCCGPQSLLDAVRDAHRRLSPAASLYTERFTSGAPAPAELPVPGATQEQPFRVELRRSGRTLHVPADRTLLEVVREVVPQMPYSCEEGYCGACETKVLGGRPDHRDEILSPEERAESNTMMICVGRALSETLVLDL
jgi:ferredoxin-NADP reductase